MNKCKRCMYGQLVESDIEGEVWDCTRELSELECQYESSSLDAIKEYLDEYWEGTDDTIDPVEDDELLEFIEDEIDLDDVTPEDVHEWMYPY